MLRGILFNDDKYFYSLNDDNLMDILTNNTIVICEDNKIKDFLYKAITEICDGQHSESGYDYYIEPEDKLCLKVGLNYLPTTELFIDDNQKIVLTMEAPYILTAKSPDDIWIAQRSCDNRIAIYPIRVFKGYKEKWDEGVDAVYQFIVNGRYGDYRYGNIVTQEIGVKN